MAKLFIAKRVYPLLRGKGLSERLYDWRRKNDFSQSEAALKLNISKRTLQEWEQGRAKPRHLAMAAITAALGR